MGNRFTDSAKWRDPWYMSLSVLHKALWMYLCDNVDNAGVWNVNHRLVEFEIGAVVDLNSALAAYGDRVRSIKNGERWYLTKFLKYQYPGGLSATCNPHKQIIRLLISHGLDYELDAHSADTPAQIQTIPDTNLGIPRKGSGRVNEPSIEASKTRQDKTGQEVGLVSLGVVDANPDADPFLAAAVVPVSAPREPAARSCEDEWRFGIASETWARSLSAAGAKIGPKNWPRWKAIVATHGLDLVISSLPAIPATDRWPDATETALARSRGQTPTASAISKRPSIQL